MTIQVIFFLQISSLFCVFDILQQYKYYSTLHSPFSLLGNHYMSLNLYVSWLLFRHSVMSDSVTPWNAARQACFPVLCRLPESAQIHVHQVSDAIQPSHPLSSPSPPAFYLSQHHNLFQLVSSSHQVAKVLEFQLQYQSFQ